jgi:2-dehydro-3-deoxyphosphogluconate aldolase/(4S)-4-hydroxy-2-oxoglutarate aldolase
MKTKESSLKAITDQGILPLFYFEDAQVSLDIIRTLYKAGIRVLEYTNRGPAALANFSMLIETLKTEMQDLYLGIGTIKTVKEAEDFIAAGAHFIVCPIVNPEVGELVHSKGLLWNSGMFYPYRNQYCTSIESGIDQIVSSKHTRPILYVCD